MKNYKTVDKTIIGCSDMAYLTAKNNEKEVRINYGEDGLYKAYILTEEYDIPSHYELVDSFKDTVLILDDDNRSHCEFHAEKINIYRSGEFGTIIQTINEKITA